MTYDEMDNLTNVQLLEMINKLTLKRKEPMISLIGYFYHLKKEHNTNFSVNRFEMTIEELKAYIEAFKNYLLTEIEKNEVFETKDFKNFEIKADPKKEDWNGFFEHNLYGDEMGGMLMFEGGELIDFDGCFMLPKAVGEWINSQNGLTCDISHFCE